MEHKTYVTFGFDHRHVINDVVYDNKCVAVITSTDPKAGRELAFEAFGPKFCFEYPERHWDNSRQRMEKFFPRGYIDVPDTYAIAQNDSHNGAGNE
jgi:hypothetical protein